MGEVEIVTVNRSIEIRSHIITYGNASGDEITQYIREEIEQMWNEPQAAVLINGDMYAVRFRITAAWQPLLLMAEVNGNTNPANNYFRIEEFAHGNISFVDGLGCNSGYFKLDNLHTGSTTAAHEYGHTIGLNHPEVLDCRGKGVPGIMYPRGTLVAPSFQYDPCVPAGEIAGTLHPKFRKVLSSDIAALSLEKLRFKNDRAIAGEFSNVFHFNHSHFLWDEAI